MLLQITNGGCCMIIEPKLENPICIKLNNEKCYIISGENFENEYCLSQGLVFSKEHYGFVLIVDYNGKQKEYVYPSQCKIIATGIDNSNLKIFEEGKKLCWIFDKKGSLFHSTYDDFNLDYKEKNNIKDEEFNKTYKKACLKNPIKIKISNDENFIIKDENIDENYPLYPGAMISSEHYGFILIVDSTKGQREIVYPTQNKITAIGMEKSNNDNIRIFEEGKYNPWIFTRKGLFKQKSSYNQYSRRDMEFIENCCELNNEEIKNNFSLILKKIDK